MCTTTRVSLKVRILSLLLVLAPVAMPVAAQEVIDGRLSGVYGPPIVVQTGSTYYGDNNLTDGYRANGLELDAAHAFFQNDTLYLFFTGNLTSDGYPSVSLELFIDCIPGGQNVLLSNNANVDEDGLNRMAGLTFDRGFDPDFYFTMKCKNLGPSTDSIPASFADLPSAGAGTGVYLGTTNAGGYFPGPNSKRIEFTLWNDNTVGVGLNCPFTDNGSGATSGMEILIPLTSLGSPTGCVRMCAFINRLDHSRVSGQFLAPAPFCPEFGEPSVLNLDEYGGDQFFSACPRSTPVIRSTWGRLKTVYR